MKLAAPRQHEHNILKDKANSCDCLSDSVASTFSFLHEVFQPLNHTRIYWLYLLRQYKRPNSTFLMKNIFIAKVYTDGRMFPFFILPI